METFPFNQVKLTCPTTVHGGTFDPTISRADLDLWNGETTARCRIRIFAGDHSYQTAHLETLLADLLVPLELCQDRVRIRQVS